MLTASERYALLERAEELLAERRYSEIIRLLAGAQEEFAEEPMLAALLASSYAFSLHISQATGLINWLKGLRLSAMHPKLRLRVANAEGVLEFEKGNLPEAWTIWSSVLHGATALREDVFVSGSHLNLANIYCIRGCYDDALTHYQRAWHGYLAVGAARQGDVCLQNLGLCYRWIGMYQTADEYFTRAVQSAKERQSSYDLACALIERAVLKGLQQDIRVGEILAAEGYQISVANRYLLQEAEALRAFGTLSNYQEDWSGALDYLRRAMAQDAAKSARLLTAEVYEQEAVAYRGLGQTKNAIAKAEEAARLYEGMGALYHRDRLMREFGIVAPHMSDS